MTPPEFKWQAQVPAFQSVLNFEIFSFAVLLQYLLHTQLAGIGKHHARFPLSLWRILRSQDILSACESSNVSEVQSTLSNRNWIKRDICLNHHLEI